MYPNGYPSAAELVAAAAELGPDAAELNPELGLDAADAGIGPDGIQDFRQHPGQPIPPL